jgi:hypothetical protein
MLARRCSPLLPELKHFELPNTRLSDKGALQIGLSREYKQLEFGPSISHETVDQIRKRWPESRVWVVEPFSQAKPISEGADATTD